MPVSSDPDNETRASCTSAEVDGKRRQRRLTENEWKERAVHDYGGERIGGGSTSTSSPPCHLAPLIFISFLAISRRPFRRRFGTDLVVYFAINDREAITRSHVSPAPLPPTTTPGSCILSASRPHGLIAPLSRALGDSLPHRISITRLRLAVSPSAVSPPRRCYWVLFEARCAFNNFIVIFLARISKRL